MNDNLRDNIIDICEGNPGGLTVLIQLVELCGEEAINEVAKCEGLRGSEIWLLFKDENKQLLGSFFSDILSGEWRAKLEANRDSSFYKGGKANG